MYSEHTLLLLHDLQLCASTDFEPGLRSLNDTHGSSESQADRTEMVSYTSAATHRSRLRPLSSSISDRTHGYKLELAQCSSQRRLCTPHCPKPGISRSILQWLRAIDGNRKGWQQGFRCSIELELKGRMRMFHGQYWKDVRKERFLA